MDKLIKFLDASQLWVSTHTDLLALVGIPLLTLLVTWKTNLAAEKRATEQRNIERKLAQELKLVEFRQAWINDLRSAFSQLHGTITEKPVNVSKIAELTSRITLLMNPNDEDHQELQDVLTALLVDRKVSATPPLAKSKIIGQRILKREWERLKSDLVNVDKKL